MIAALTSLQDAFWSALAARRDISAERCAPFAARLAAMGVEWRWTGIACPLQAEGTVDGWHLYFRARYDHWEVWIAASPDDWFTERAWVDTERFGTGYDASWMDDHIGLGFIIQAVRRFRGQPVIQVDSRAWTGLEPTWWEAQGIGTRADAWADRWGAWKHERLDELKALATIWGYCIPNRPRDPRKGWTVFDGMQSDRGGDWTFLRAVKATIAILLGRRYRDSHRERDWARWKARRANPRFIASQWIHPEIHMPISVEMAHWDYRGAPGGWSSMVLYLHPGCRVSIFSDGDSSL